jgi:hypothetical protein
VSTYFQGLGYFQILGKKTGGKKVMRWLTLEAQIP